MNLATHLRHARIERGLTQEQVALGLIERYKLKTKPKSVVRNIIHAEDIERRFTRTPPTVHRLASWYEWPVGAVERALEGHDPLGRGTADEPMSRAAKEDWRRRIQASDKLSAEAKRQNLAFLDLIPDSD